MEFLTFLYQLFIMPLQIAFEVIYYMAFKLTGNFGVSIVALSFCVSLLLVPLYSRADAIQKEEHAIEAKLAKGVEHIKKTFRGDEQLMMLQTYYRKNNYSPLYFLRGSLSLFLQIPFFIAAYQFLSNMELLKGVSFGFIKDLAAPDALLSIGGLTINVLPIIMTLVNLASTYFFTKGFSLKTKLQLNGMALFFLVFLYNSPAGLVCYWTCNNIFNLLKFFVGKHIDAKKIGSKSSQAETRTQYRPSVKIFILGTVFLAMLVGAVIPSAVIESSPQEFVIMDHFSNPLVYVVNATAVSFGTFVFWAGVFYWIASPKYKILFERIVWICCGVAVINYMFFGKDLGLLTSTLQYETGMKFSRIERIINVIVVIACAYGMNFIWKRNRNMLHDYLFIGIVALAGMVGTNIYGIQESIDNIVFTASNKGINNKLFSLSRSGKNVVVIMLDRGMGAYVPFFIKEKPELKDKFDGFTYYSNTISFGGHTNFASPSFFGGYEYTPLEMNKRDSDSLVHKHNEALKVMPVIFANNNFDVTVCDQPLANYQWIPDLSIYDNFPKIKTHITKGKFGNVLMSDNDTVQVNKRNFFCFGLMKCMPVLLQRTMYNKGDYFSGTSMNQKLSSLLMAVGYKKSFFENYNVLVNLKSITEIKETGNTFLSFTNNVTHEPALLQLPEYQPQFVVNNKEYEKYTIGQLSVDDKKLNMKTERQVIHYHTNMSTLMKLGEWFDFLRENNIYDNTRIIVAADHGNPLGQIEELILDNGKDEANDLQRYYPLLLVKDFNSVGFKTSDEFMTNADIPSIVVKNLIKKPVNPFTGKLIDNTIAKSQKQYILASWDFNISKNNGNTYFPGRWYSVHTNIWDKSNWELVKEKAVLPY